MSYYWGVLESENEAYRSIIDNPTISVSWYGGIEILNIMEKTDHLNCKAYIAYKYFWTLYLFEFELTFKFFRYEFLLYSNIRNFIGGYST